MFRIIEKFRKDVLLGMVENIEEVIEYVSNFEGLIWKIL